MNLKEKSTYQSLNKSLFMPKFRPIFVAVSPAIWESLGTKNVSSMHAQNFWKE